MANRAAFATAMLLLTWLAATSATAIPAAGAAEKPVAVEKNPPGDIPDDQVFVVYKSPLGFSMKIPEGWARKERSDGASFSDKFGAVDVAVSATSAAPTIQQVKADEGVALERAGRAVVISAIKLAQLPSGSSVLIQYTSNSEPNAVTSKQIRLEHDRYLVFDNGRLATLDLSAPAGADNADQWQLMSQSFRWQ
jgi:hypothetical protein